MAGRMRARIQAQFTLFAAIPGLLAAPFAPLSGAAMHSCTPRLAERAVQAIETARQLKEATLP